MRFGRLVRHLSAANWRARMLFPNSTLDAIEQAIGRAERTHGGEIRFAIETALQPLNVINELGPRGRAAEVFANLRVWDTVANNGVLIYVLLADRAVEILADRGLHERIEPAEWDAVCRLMERHFRDGHYETGAISGVEAVGALLARHYPAASDSNTPGINQLPDRPTLL